MILKFFNGYVCDVPNISKECTIDNYKAIYDYIIEHQENIGISQDDLIFVQQVNFIEDETNRDMIYVFIQSISILDIYIVFSWIDSITLSERENKAQRYLQYLCDRHLLYLSTGTKYCELWFNNKKVSSCWDGRKLDNIEIDKTDDNKYICKNVPISISQISQISNKYHYPTYYYPTLSFDEEDLD